MISILTRHYWHIIDQTTKYIASPSPHTPRQRKTKSLTLHVHGGLRLVGSVVCSCLLRICYNNSCTLYLAECLTHTYTLAYTHSSQHTYICNYIYANIIFHIHPTTHTHTTHTHLHIYTIARTHAHTHTRTYTLTYLHTYTITQAPTARTHCPLLHTRTHNKYAYMCIIYTYNVCNCIMYICIYYKCIIYVIDSSMRIFYVFAVLISTMRCLCLIL